MITTEFEQAFLKACMRGYSKGAPGVSTSRSNAENLPAMRLTKRRYLEDPQSANLIREDTHRDDATGITVTTRAPV